MYSYQVNRIILGFVVLGSACLALPVFSKEKTPVPLDHDWIDTSRNGQVVYAVALTSHQAKAGSKEAPAPKDTLLFDFEKPANVKVWSNLILPAVKQKEPPVKIELSAENATRGKHSLKLTFAGGRWPTITTTDVPEDWMPYWTFRADVTAIRHCLVGFTVMQEKSKRGGGWDPIVSR